MYYPATQATQGQVKAEAASPPQAIPRRELATGRWADESTDEESNSEYLSDGEGAYTETDSCTASEDSDSGASDDVKPQPAERTLASRVCVTCGNAFATASTGARPQCGTCSTTPAAAVLPRTGTAGSTAAKAARPVPTTASVSCARPHPKAANPAASVHKVPRLVVKPTPAAPAHTKAKSAKTKAVGSRADASGKSNQDGAPDLSSISNSVPASGRLSRHIDLEKAGSSGFLFVCNHQTYSECMSNMLFGLPRSNLRRMQQHIKVRATWCPLPSCPLRCRA